MVDAGVVLTQEQTAELRAVVNSRDVPAVLATRARIVLWMAEGRRRKDVAELAGVSLPTVDRWVDRYAEHGLAGLEVFYPEHTPAVTRKYLALAQKLGLFVTGGSDYHGVPEERELGDGQIDEEKAYLPFFR